MKKLFITLSLLLVLLSCSGDKHNLKVLYVGGAHDYSEYKHNEKNVPANGVEVRTAAFERYLKSQFSDVTMTTAEEYKQEMSKDYDVTVIDNMLPDKAPMRRDAELYSGRKSFVPMAKLEEGYDYPTIIIGRPAADNGYAIGSKFTFL